MLVSEPSSDPESQNPKACSRSQHPTPKAYSRSQHPKPVSVPNAQRLKPTTQTALCLLAVLLGLIALQIFARGSTNRREKPGPSRGDLVLTEDALPTELAGWTRTKFIPAPAVDELSEGQYWWVHQWQYQKDRTTALVSFDQLGEDRWHELTYCYRILDWVLDDRSIQTDESSAGKYVLARMSKEGGQHGLLVFSVFFENGEWDLPPDFELSLVNSFTQDQGLIGRMARRFRPPEIPQGVPARNETAIQRALQCQVFIATAKPISGSLVADTIELHLQSRNQFQSHWLAARHSTFASKTLTTGD